MHWRNIYHNPRCTKSRQTLELLKSRGVEPTVIEYLKTPPSPARIKQLITWIGKSPLHVVRTKEAAYAASGLSAKSSKDAVAKAAAARIPAMSNASVYSG